VFVDRTRLFSIAGWAITIAVTVFMLRDISPDLQQAPWVVKANAGLGIPANVVLPIGLLGLASTLAYALPQTSTLGAILLTGFLGGAVVVHLRVNGAMSDMGENALIGVLAWTGLWMRDGRLRALLPIRRPQPTTPAVS
jgi:hypothetical protein